MRTAAPMERYLERARAAGAEAVLVPGSELASRLELLLRETRAGVAALALAASPGAVRAVAEETLRRAGCRTVSPEPAAGGFRWDRSALKEAGLGITWCDAFLAETGSLVLPSGPGLGTLASLLPPVHLALSDPEGLHPDLGAYLADLGTALPSRLTLISGPSRTGDIEGTMTTGVHGPGRVLHWILTED